MWVIFLLTWMVPTSFADRGPKLGVLYLGGRSHPPTHIMGENDKIGHISGFPRCPIFKFCVVTGMVFIHVMHLTPAPVNFFCIGNVFFVFPKKSVSSGHKPALVPDKWIFFCKVSIRYTSNDSGFPISVRYCKLVYMKVTNWC